MLSRRRLLQSGLYTAAGVTFGKRLSAFGQVMASGRPGTQWRQISPLRRSPSDPSCDPFNGHPTEILELEMLQFQQKMHGDLPATTV
jgi:hypothetical protein